MVKHDPDPRTLDDDVDPRYYQMDGPGKADKHPDRITKFDRHDWSRDSRPEKLYDYPDKESS